MMAHIADAASQGHRRVVVRTVDTDAVVLPIHVCPRLTDLISYRSTMELETMFDIYIPVHAIAEKHVRPIC